MSGYFDQSARSLESRCVVTIKTIFGGHLMVTARLGIYGCVWFAAHRPYKIYHVWNLTPLPFKLTTLSNHWLISQQSDNLEDTPYRCVLYHGIITIKRKPSMIRASVMQWPLKLVEWAMPFTVSQIAKFMGPTWGPPGSCRPQMGPMLAPWTLLSGVSRGKSLRSPTQTLLSAICGVVSIKWRGWHPPLVRHLSSGAHVNSCHELSRTRLTALIPRSAILSFRWLPETMWYHGHVFYTRRYSFKMCVTIIEKYRRLSRSRIIPAQIKENIKAPRHWPLWGEFTGDRWIPRTNGQ